MKHIKKYNEELKPDTYIRAGSTLRRYGKETKASALIDYGYEKKYGFYNAHISYLDIANIFTGQITNPNCNFYFGLPEFTNRQLVNDNITDEELVSSWKNGQSELGFTLEFRFTSSESLKSKVPQGLKLRSEIQYNFHLFTIYVSLSDWYDGLEEYNYLEEKDRYVKPDDPDYTDLFGLYQNTKHIYMHLTPNLLLNKGVYGIFSDRQSALKFRRQLPELISQHKGKIMDILSIIGGDSSDLEDIIESFSKIRINSLYQDENIQGKDLYKKWYRAGLL